jgi:hypothetical protein
MGRRLVWLMPHAGAQTSWASDESTLAKPLPVPYLRRRILDGRRSMGYPAGLRTDLLQNGVLSIPRQAYRWLKGHLPLPDAGHYIHSSRWELTPSGRRPRISIMAA